MPARAFVPPVPPGEPRPPISSGFRMQLPRAVQQAVADADRAQRRRRALATALPQHRRGDADNQPLIPVELGRLFGRATPGPTPG